MSEDWKSRALAAESRLVLAEKVVGALKALPCGGCLDPVGRHHGRPGVPEGCVLCRPVRAALTAYAENTSSNDLTTGEDDA